VLQWEVRFLYRTRSFHDQVAADFADKGYVRTWTPPNDNAAQRGSGSLASHIAGGGAIVVGHTRCRSQGSVRIRPKNSCIQRIHRYTYTGKGL
jgi:hypothetical protein